MSIETTADAPASMRDRILESACHRFTTSGYDGTSLREIAEDLGVTKAALYYHFKSKDAILLDLVGSFRGHAQELIDWAHEHCHDTGFAESLLTRFSAVMFSDAPILRLFHENLPVVRALLTEKSEREGVALPAKGWWITELVEVLAGVDADRMQRARARAAVVSIISASIASHESGDDADAAAERSVALAVALEIVSVKAIPPS